MVLNRWVSALGMAGDHRRALPLAREVHEMLKSPQNMFEAELAHLSVRSLGNLYFDIGWLEEVRSVHAVHVLSV